jgi:iron(III) transport system substrate-binding protein
MSIIRLQELFGLGSTLKVAKLTERHSLTGRPRMVEDWFKRFKSFKSLNGCNVLNFFCGLLIFFCHGSLSFAQSTPDWKVEWEKVQAAAKKEGKVVVWGPPGAEARKALSEGFQKSFPAIEVEYTGASGSKVAPRLIAERRSGQYLVDIHIGGTTTMLESLLDSRVLDPIPPALILPEVIDPRRWWQGRLDFSDREGKYNLVFSTNVKTPVAINPQLTKKDLLRSYWDLLSPQWSGKIAMRDPLTAGPGLATATFWYAQPGLAKEFIHKFFTQQKVVFSRDDRQMLEWVARGEHLIAVAPSELQATGLRSKGLPIELVRAEQFKESSYLTAGFGSVVLINRAPHPQASRAYLNWLLSREGQTEWSRSSGYVSRRLDVARDHLDPALIPQEGVSYQPNYKEEYVRLREEILLLLEGVLKR